MKLVSSNEIHRAKVYQKHTTIFLFTSLASEDVSRNPLQKKSKPRKVNQHPTEIPEQNNNHTTKTPQQPNTHALSSRGRPRDCRPADNYAKLSSDVATLRHQLKSSNLKLRLPLPMIQKKNKQTISHKKAKK